MYGLLRGHEACVADPISPCFMERRAAMLITDSSHRPYTVYDDMHRINDNALDARDPTSRWDSDTTWEILSDFFFFFSFHQNKQETGSDIWICSTNFEQNRISSYPRLPCTNKGDSIGECINQLLSASVSTSLSTPSAYMRFMVIIILIKWVKLRLC